MNINMETVVVKKDDVILRKLGNYSILVPINSEDQNLNNLFNINDIGKKIMEFINEPKSIIQIINNLSKIYPDIDKKIMEKDVFDYVLQLINLKLIKIVAS